ncbi:MAG: hypothetical protein AB1Z50_12150 [Desulfuromonadales bacterium]
MKTQKACLTAAIACLLVVFASGFACAASLDEITDEFCAEVQKDSINAVDELAEGKADMIECVDEFFECQTKGLIGGDSMPECIKEGLHCSKFANRDELQACEQFDSQFEAAYDRALRQARRAGVENGFQLWLNTPPGEECLQPAVYIAGVCAEALALALP